MFAEDLCVVSRAVEFDAPHVLLQDRQSYFQMLVAEMPAREQAELRATARVSYLKHKRIEVDEV
jgi:hypothetical protein